MKHPAFMARWNHVWIAVAILATSSAITASSLPALEDCTFFPENERYGYFEVFCEGHSLGGQCYQFVKASGPGIVDTLPHVVRSLLAPRLCDEDAVAFIAPGGDRDTLIVLSLSTEGTRTTVFELIPRRLKDWAHTRHPDTVLYTPHEFCYISQQRVFAHNQFERYTMFEIDRVQSQTEYTRTFSGLGEVSGPSQDFKRIFVVRFGGVENFITPHPRRLLSYDLAADSITLLSEHYQIASPFAQRDSRGPIYAGVTPDSGLGTNLCRIESDSLSPLTDFQYPIYMHDFQLFRDSVVVWHRSACDPDYGTRRLVIRESGDH